MLIEIVAAAMLVSAGEPDGIVTTAPNGAGAIPVGAEAPTPTEIQAAGPTQVLTAHGLTTDEQIDAWIASRDPEARPFAEAIDPWMEDDREVHGEVSAEIGTGDYSAYSAAVSLPIGETGRINLSYSQSSNSYGYGYPYRHYGYGPGGFGPGGFGATGRYGYGFGAPHVFEPGVAYPGRSPTGGWRRERVAEQGSTTSAED